MAFVYTPHATNFFFEVYALGYTNELAACTIGNVFWGKRG